MIYFSGGLVSCCHIDVERTNKIGLVLTAMTRLPKLYLTAIPYCSNAHDTEMLVYSGRYLDSRRFYSIYACENISRMVEEVRKLRRKFPGGTAGCGMALGYAKSFFTSMDH